MPDEKGLKTVKNLIVAVILDSRNGGGGNKRNFKVVHTAMTTPTAKKAKDKFFNGVHTHKNKVMPSKSVEGNRILGTRYIRFSPV